MKSYMPSSVQVIQLCFQNGYETVASYLGVAGRFESEHSSDSGEIPSPNRMHEESSG